MYPFNLTEAVVGRARVEIPKPLAEVFNFVGNDFFINYPRWALEVTEFKPLAGNEVFIGAKARQIREEQGQNVETEFEISEFDPPKKVTLKGIVPPYRNTYQFSGKNDPSFTELEFSFELLELELFMRPFQKLIRTAIEEGAETTVANIKDLFAERDC